MGKKSRVFAHLILSPNSRFADLEVEIAESLLPYPRTLGFAETVGGDWFNCELPPDRGTARPRVPC